MRWDTDADGAVAWQRWYSPVVDTWRGNAQTWFDEYHSNLLAEIFPSFAAMLLHRHLGTPFRLALQWYRKCNLREGGMEGTIVLGLTALDLLGALIVVDDKSLMSASKYDHLWAASKLAKLLQVLEVGASIPEPLSSLADFASAQRWADTTVALTEIRHGYVHSNPKRRGIVLSAPHRVTLEAWQLALWYQELAVLHLLDHHGEYRNRLTAECVGVTETVPWA